MANLPRKSKKSRPSSKVSAKSEPATAWVRVPLESEVPQEVQVLFGKFREKTGFVPNVARNFALMPEHFMRWFRYYDFLMRSEPGQLSRKEREMIAVVVSAANQCEYCLASHSAYLREVSDPVLPEVLAANYRRAHLSPRERALCDFALEMTLDSARMTPSNLQMLRSLGLSDEAILEAAQVAAMFNFTNRLANALGWVPNEVYYAQGREPL